MRSIAILLTIVLSLSAIPLFTSGEAQNAGDFEVTDPKGDSSALGFTPVGTPSNPLNDGADITSLKIYGEDLDGLTIELGVADLTPQPQVFGLGGAQFMVSFMLEGTQITYYTYFYAYRTDQGDPVAPAKTGTERIPADFQICVPESGCYTQRILGTVNWDDSLVTGYLPKGALAGREPMYDDSYPSGVPPIRSGSRLASIRAQSYGNIGFYDSIPDSGVAGPYVLKTGVPNDKIGVSLVHFDGGYGVGQSPFGAIADFPAATITPGAPGLVQLRVSNFNAAKRIINISAQVVDPADAQQWSVRVVNTLTIPGGDDRIINLIVNASNSVKHRDESLVRVTARSLGFADEVGSLRLRLVAAVTPTPTQKTLYAHVNDRNAGGISFCLPSCGSGPMWLNTLEEDPLSNDAAGAEMSPAIGLTTSEFYFQMTLDTQLNRDLVLDTRKPIAAHIVSTCTVCPQGTLKLDLHSDQGIIASGEAPFGTTTDIELLPVLDRVAGGSYMGMFGTLEATSPPPLAKEMIPRIIGGKTFFELPVIPDPDAKVGQRVPLGPAFMTLSTENATGQFIGPGKSKVFPVTVVNEGIEEDVVKITLKHEPLSWELELQPGDSYRLKPGESATFGLLVRAPENATEGETVSIIVNATSSVDPDGLAQLQIEATASDNAFDEEEDEFEVDEDTELALQEAPKKSPGPGLVAFLGLAIGLAAWQRRRTA